MLDTSIIDADSMLIEAFVDHLVRTYEHMYCKDFPKGPATGRMKEVIETCATSAAQIISVGTDTPYHDLKHTVDVTLTLQEMAQGKLMNYTALSSSVKCWLKKLILHKHVPA